MLPLLCPGINFTFRFSIAGLRIRDAKLYDTLLMESLAGILNLQESWLVSLLEVIIKILRYDGSLPNF